MCESAESWGQGAANGKRPMDHNSDPYRQEASPAIPAGGVYQGAPISVLHAGEHVLRSLESRRSVGQGFLSEPGPGREELFRILSIATCVPDHGNLEPWRLIVFSDDTRIAVGERLSAAYRHENNSMELHRLEKFANSVCRAFSHTPLTVLVISSPSLMTKIPIAEQEASAAAVCMNMLNAVHAYGFGAKWVTGWAASSSGAAAVYGLNTHERVVGIIHIGTPTEYPKERKRPDLNRIVRYNPIVEGTNSTTKRNLT